MTLTTGADLRVLPSGGPLGAEIRGLDLGRELTPGEVKKVRAALLEHCVLVFRDQRISDEDQVRFTSCTSAAPWSMCASSASAASRRSSSSPT